MDTSLYRGSAVLRRWGKKHLDFIDIIACKLFLTEKEGHGGLVGQPMGKGCIEKSRELPQYLEKAARLTGAHYLNAAECEFNRVDGMHLTRQGHARLAELLARRVPELVEAVK